MASGNSPLEQQKRPTRYDPFFGDREMQLAYRALMEGAWTQLDSFLAGSDAAWVFSETILSPVVDIESINIDRWIAANDSPHGRVFRAGTILRDASTLVTDQGGEHRAREMAQRAEAILRDVITERPSLAEPWVQLLISGRILGLQLSELRQRFDNAHSRQPFHPGACREYLQSLSAKWGGSQAAAFDFARWVDVEAPAGSPSGEVLAMAHVEHGLVSPHHRSMQEYLAEPDVITELANGAIKILNATLSPAPVRMLPALNTYALALGVHDVRTAQIVEHLFDYIDNRPTAYPWNLYEEEGIITVFNTIKSERLREAERY